MRRMEDEAYRKELSKMDDKEFVKEVDGAISNPIGDTVTFPTEVMQRFRNILVSWVLDADSKRQTAEDILKVQTELDSVSQFEERKRQISKLAGFTLQNISEDDLSVLEGVLESLRDKEQPIDTNNE
jgi:hypothetical protein